MLAKKTWRIVAIRQIRQNFLPAKVLFYTVFSYCNRMVYCNRVENRAAACNYLSTFIYRSDIDIQTDHEQVN